MQPKTTIEIGKEYDQAVFEALRCVLSCEGARVEEESWGVGGSQEVSTCKVQIGNEEIEITAETYMGLTITGAAELVSRLASAINEAKTH